LLGIAGTFPANHHSELADAPANWETLPSQWETTHAINAVLIFAAFAR
jgi:hypothetical protein